MVSLPHFFLQLLLTVFVHASCPNNDSLAHVFEKYAEESCGLRVFGDETKGWREPENCVGEFCVYWNPDFNGGRGVAAVTTASQAQAIAKFTERLELQHTDAPYFKTAIPGKGNGIVAKRQIARGETIMVLPPTLLVSSEAYHTFTGQQGNTIFSQALDKLSDMSRSEMQAIHGSEIVSKIDKNGFTVFVDETPYSQHIGVFPQAAAMNHDCRPNINYRLNNITQTTTAVREITSGEELTVSYVDLMLPRKQRRARLLQWGFNCTCNHCMKSASASAQSDANLARIQLLERELDSPNSTVVTATTGEELVALYEEERLDIYLGPAYTRAALNYGLFGVRNKAVEFAEKAIAALERQYGPQAADIPSLRALREEPEKHWTWALRKKAVIQIPGLN